MGQQVWYMRRAATTQYALRNTYAGELHKGMRQGFGVFHYASGACYEGEWKSNVKSGKVFFIISHSGFCGGRIHYITLHRNF